MTRWRTGIVHCAQCLHNGKVSVVRYAETTPDLCHPLDSLPRIQLRHTGIDCMALLSKLSCKLQLICRLQCRQCAPTVSANRQGTGSA